jgi:hypothetical protein
METSKVELKKTDNPETIKIKVQREVKTEEEVEIKLPYYSKSPAFYFKVVSADEAIRTCNIGVFGIDIVVTNAKYAFDHATEITAEEFYAELKKVSKLIKAKLFSCK